MIEKFVYLILVILAFNKIGLKASTLTKCKYILVEKTFYNKYQSNFLYKLTQITSGRVELNQNFIKYHLDDCFNTDLMIQSLESAYNKSIVYGVDLSSNQLDQIQFEKIINTNLVFKLSSNKIRYLNLSDNQFSNLKSDLMEQFTNLEVLILDKNPKLIINDFMIKNKMKIISLNKCNLNENNLIANFNSSSEIKLIYLGLSGNKLNNLTCLEKFIKHQVVIEQLDLSFNKIEKLPNYFLQNIKISKLNLEKNLIDHFNINDFIINSTNFEINLKSNFIRNTSIENYKLKTSPKNLKISVRLLGNPLICDCNSMWLLEQSKKQAVKVSLRSFLSNKKTAKSKREIEELTYHNIENDPNFNDSFMQRQKRLKSTTEPSTTTLSIGQNIMNDGIIRIFDLDTITCNYIDVQNFQSNDNSSLYDLSNFEDEDLRRQNIQVDNIKYKEKPISQSQYQDYMCSYEDHCKPDECDCCMFQHCHCRSICPSKCHCYFDSKLEQNIIDCSELNFIDVPNQVPIESATDMRLNSNSLKIVKPHTFFGFGQLKFLYLQNNQISYLTSDAFEDLKYSLKLLNLANNQLTYLNGDEFNSLSELNVLILNQNPIKDIDNVYFIDFKFLPNLKLIYMSETSLNEAKMNELVRYSKTNTNATVKYKVNLPDTTTTATTTQVMTSTTPISTTSIILSSITAPKDELIDFIDLILLEKQQSISTTSKEPELVTHKEEDLEDFVLMKSTKFYNTEDQPDEILIINPPPLNNQEINDDLLLNIKQDQQDFELMEQPNTKNRKSFLFFNTNYDLISLLRWYYFPILVFAVCLITSIILVIVVILLARKFDVRPPVPASSKKHKKKSCFDLLNLSKKQKNNSSTSSSSYFTTPSNNCEDLEGENSEEEESDDESTIKHNSLFGKIALCFKSSQRRSNKTFKQCHRSNSFDSDSVIGYGYDSASVPVSRSIQNFNLNVFIYYNILDESYVINYLLPLLKKCLVIIPDTKFITKPLATKYITVGPGTFFENTTLSKQNESIYLDQQITMLNRNYLSNVSNSLVSNILVISDNFHGYKPLNESFMSIKLNNTTNNNTNKSSCLIYTNNHRKISQTSNQQQRMLDSAFKNSFKIYINTNKYDISVNNSIKTNNNNNNNNNNSKTQSLNQGLLRKIYDNYTTKANNSSSSSSSTSSSTVSSTINNSCNTNSNNNHNRNSIFISNDSNSSFGFNDKLQFKLEKHFESICLKSNTLFSKTNFSYVDYTKR